ncbi:MAG: ABC transporter ATP-binding protein [Candidatus Thorarchaeota archaeon]|nr:ABC transporter ATP-binding protein [Candidatus Thorarchaeota archaeon]
MTSAIRTENVWKTYHPRSPRQVDAVRDISIEIEEGTIAALGGPSGSGKSTALSLIGLLTRPSQGKVYLGTEDVSRVSEVFRTKMRRDTIGFIFQTQYLIPQLTATENVALPLLCTDISRSKAEEIAKERLISVDMEHRLDFRVVELSGGELQRVSIARALMNKPKILIADEPSSSIDEALTKELLNTLRTMVDDEGLTVVVASHDPMVLQWADVHHLLHDGQIVQDV